MSSETREIQHDQHAHPGHPGAKLYVLIGVILTVLTAFEVLLYYMEADWGMLSVGWATVLILILSAAKFILVVMFYMHLKFDSKLFSGVFLLPATLATLVIVGMLLLYHLLPTSYPYRPL